MKTIIERSTLRRSCVRTAAVAILSLGSFLFGSLAAEVPSSVESRASQDASSVLEQTELRVLTQHYEKTLTAFYDAQLELRLRENSSNPESLPAEARRAAEAELQGRSLRVRILAEWTERIRVQITDKVERINVHEEKLRSARRANEPVRSPAKPSATGSSSSSAPEPKRQPEL